MGRISGVMRVMLPQGRVESHHFNDELGWKARASGGVDGDDFSFVVYCRSACMNPLWGLPCDETSIDTSGVKFAPLRHDDLQEILLDPKLDPIFRDSIERLQSEYEILRAGGSYPPGMPRWARP
jgi:hypothetical protein